MKKIELSEELVKEMHEHFSVNKKGYYKKMLEREAPQLFKKPLEVGKWYTDNNGILYCLVSIDDTPYNCSYYGFYGGYWLRQQSHCNFKGLIEATRKQVETALIAEWEKNNKSFENYAYHEPNCLKEYSNVLFGWGDDEEIIELFNNSKWATIEEPTKEMTIEEIQKELGCKIKIVE